MSKEDAIEAYTWLEYAVMSLAVILVLLHVHYLLIPLVIVWISYRLRFRIKRYYKFTLTSLLWISVLTTAVTFGVAAVFYQILLLLMMYLVIHLYYKGQTIWSDYENDKEN